MPEAATNALCIRAVVQPKHLVLCLLWMPPAAPGPEVTAADLVSIPQPIAAILLQLLG